MPRTHFSGITLARRFTRWAIFPLLAVLMSACGASSTASHPTGTVSPAAAGKPLVFVAALSTPTQGGGQSTTVVHAVDGATGAEVWTAHLQGHATTPPLVEDGTVFVSTSESSISTEGTPIVTSVTGHLYAFDAQTGHALQEQDTPNRICQLVAAAQHLLIGVCSDITALGAAPSMATSVVAFKASDDSPAWHSVIATTSGNMALAVVSDRVFFAVPPTTSNENGARSDLTTLDVRTGAVLWHQQVVSFSPQLLASDTTLYVSTVGHTNDERGLVALDATTGANRWQRDAAPEAGLLAANHSLLFTNVILQPSQISASTSTVAALKSSDGTQAWQAPFEVNQGPATLIATESVVYGVGIPSDAASSSTPVNNRVFALDAATGTQRWSVEQGANIVAQALALGTTALFVVEGTPSGSQLVALKASNGSALWTSPLNSYAVLGPVVG